MNVNVIILNWNAPEDTIQCLAQFSTWANVTPILWVVDNASEDDSVARIQNRFPTVNLIQNEENLGFSGGTNRGIVAAMETNDAPILLLNNDATVSEKTIASLAKLFVDSPEIGIVGPLLYDEDAQNGEDAGTKRLIAAGSRNPVMHIHNLAATIPETQPAIVDYISGSVALIRRDVLEKIGLLDARYFFTGEVADLCRRSREQGFQTAVDAKSEATHELDRSRALRSTLYTYYIVRNRFLYIRKFYSGLKLPLLLFWSIYGFLLSIKLRLTGNGPSSIAVWLGTYDGIRGEFGGQNNRVLKAIATA